MVDFAVLPPEINSAQMYLGAGAGSMTSTAVVWDGLAIRLDDVAAALSAVSSNQAYRWQGSAALSMTQALAL